MEQLITSFKKELKKMMIDQMSAGKGGCVMTNEEADIMRSDFAEFIKISGAEHWKEELSAVIHIDDLNRFSRAVSFVTGSMLEEGDWHDFDKKLVEVYASGYWNAGMEG
jgi:hypothetical protein